MEQEQLVNDLKNKIVRALNEDSLPAARSSISLILSKHIPSLIDNIHKDLVLRFLLDLLQSRAVSFEEHISKCLESLSQIHQDVQEWSEAAKILMAIPMESSQRNVSSDYKIKIYLHIVRLLLEDEHGDHVQAEAYLNRCAVLLPDLASVDNEHVLSFKVCQAKILDLKRKFPDAATKYYDLSKSVFDHEEQIQALTNAIICGVLTAPGTARSRLLTTLINDDRSFNLCNESVSNMLKNVQAEKIITHEDKEEFQKLLSTHHLATLSDGSTVYDRALMEHNILAISKIYLSIHLDCFSQLLEIPRSKAESIVAKLFTELRLEGYLDQIDEYIYFDQKGTDGRKNMKYIENMFKCVEELSEALEQP